MKMVISKNTTRLIIIILCSLIFVIALLDVGGYFLKIRQISVLAANEQVDKYQVRSKLLMQATDEIGACFAKSAAEVWASGLKDRSAALQYSVMTEELKYEYAKQLEKSFPNWVTGVSSPWVESYKFNKFERFGDNKYVYEICFFNKNFCRTGR